MKQSARYIQIKVWNLLVLFGILYLLLILWIAYTYLPRNNSQEYIVDHIFRPRVSQFHINECSAVSIPHQSHRSINSNSTQIITWKPGMCSAMKEPKKSNIQMEKEWASISVRYPQYVYTISGWIQVIDVPNYEVKPLRVIIVPHSHHDLGWKDTFEGYFISFTKRMFDLMIKYLGRNPSWKFIWPEILNLEKWFSSAGGSKEDLKELINRGQLEIVTGGWVMTDEAVSHYSSMLDQLIEGHLWVHDNLGIIPNASWSVDPFGHSPTMAYLLKQAGIEKMVIQRTHFGIKRHFAKKQSLEFTWRQTWDSDGKTGIFCHMMPFLLYAIPYSCGPDPHVCCQFDFSADKCFHGQSTVPRITVDDSNIRKLAWELWEQFQKKAQLYRSDVLLVPHGDDFRYSESDEWKQQFENLGRLMNYMNKDKDMNIKVEFGTVSDYFRALEEDSKKSKITFPSLSGDFLPYNDRDDQYWTGFYSARPLFKHMVRILQAKLRITEILLSLTIAQSVKLTRELYTKNGKVLTEARRALGLFHHHDAITGTSKKFVMADYGKILQNTLEKVNELLALLMLNNLIEEEEKLADLPQHAVFMLQEWLSPVSPPSLTVSQFDDTWFVVVTNPLTIPWTSAITVRASTPSLVRIKDGHFVPSQINPVIGQGMQPTADVYDIVFIADLPALTVKMYEIVKDGPSLPFSSVTIFGKQLATTSFTSDFHPAVSNKSEIEIENNWLKATFSSCTGSLQYTLRKTDNTVHKMEVKMVSYGTGSWMNPFRDKSGAYIFMPDGPAQNLDSFYPSMVVIKGPVMSSVISLLSGVLHSTSLYNIPGPVGAGVHIDNMVDISSNEWANKELAMRIISDVVSPDSSLCVDLNGYQMHRKKWRSKFFIQGNFHPVTSMAYLADDSLSRLTLITSEAHGVASLSEGTIEVILDRKLMQDDWRGLNEGPHDNVPSPSRFVLLPERRDSISQSREQSCYPSLLAHLLSSHLNNPPQAVFLSSLSKKLKPMATFLMDPWPCPYNLLNIRNLGSDLKDFRALFVLHKVGVDCGYSETYMDCDDQKAPNLNSISNIQVRSAMETTVTGVKEIMPLVNFSIELKDMEIKTVKVAFR